MTAFFRFPHTPHLEWIGKGKPRTDKVLSPAEAEDLLAHRVLVEEKVDGANVGFSVDQQGSLRVQNRGAYLAWEHLPPQFKPLKRWLQGREHSIATALSPHLILFGEWCYAVHSVRYTQLPDWFLAFDVYDRASGEFWSAARRDELTHRLGLALVPRLSEGRFRLVELRGLLGHSRLSEAPAEGIYVRRDENERLVARAKLVRPDFVSDSTHWSKRSLRTNALAVHVASEPQ